MAAGPRPVPLADLISQVRLAEDPASAVEISARLPSPDEPRPVGVTDLLEPRRAFWRRRRGPAPVAPDRELRMELGRAWHRRFGDALAPEAALEVRVRRGGVSARIDALAEVPVEVKTATASPEGSEPAVWPEHVEQLAIYCALARSSVGRLVHLALRDERPPGVSVADLAFRDLAAIDIEVARREATLRSALGAGTPGGLERCHWFGMGCEYRSAGICDCRGDEPAPSGGLASQLERRDPRPELAERWSERLREGSLPSATPPQRFRDLLYPRRTFFRITAGTAPEPYTARPPGSPMDGYERTLTSLERGPLGELRRLPTEAQAPDDEVLAWRGRPVLLRSSRARSRLCVDDLKVRFPQYVVELGFRCSAARVDQGTVVIAHEPGTPGEPPLQVFDLDYAASAGGFGRLWTLRREALAEALRQDRPQQLDACPAWMFRDCPYRDRCGCADAVGRSQR